MVVVCSQCSRANPADARFCWWDGAMLVGATPGPAQPGSVRFPSPFVFPNGQACQSFDQLALACYQQGPAAIQLLKQGYLASFLGGIGRLDLAGAAREAAQFPDPDRGLDQFLSRLPSKVLDSPKLKVEPTEIHLGATPMGTQRQLELHLRNAGMRLCHGTIVSDSKWLTLGDGQGSDQKLFQFSSEASIPLHLRGQFLRAGNKTLEGHLLIESNAGNMTVTVKADVPATAFPTGMFAGALSPRQIAEKAKTQPLEAAPYFEKGEVARWYATNGWPYPVQGPTVPGIGGVQQFFEALGLAKPPKVELKTTAINLRADGGAALQASVEVVTGERKVVWAYATCDQFWVDVSRWKAGKAAVITVVIPRVPNKPQQTIRANIQVTANGNQRFTVPLSIVVGAPSPYGDDMPLPASPPPIHGMPPVRGMPPVPGAVMPALPMPVSTTAPAGMPPVPAAPMPATAMPPVPMPGVPMPAVPMPAVPMPAVPMPATPLAAVPLAATPLDAAPIAAVPFPVGAQPGAFPSPSLPAPFPSIPPASAPFPEGGTGKPSRWPHILPVALLALVLLGVFLRDTIFTSPPVGGDVNIPVDETKRLAVVFDWGSDRSGAPSRVGEVASPLKNHLLFGVCTLSAKGSPEKNLTFDLYGRSNNVLLKIDGRERSFGAGKGDDAWLESPAKPAEPASKPLSIFGKGEVSAKWKYGSEKVVVTQTVKIVPGEPVVDPKKKDDLVRQLDTVLVRFTIENQDTVAHDVGLRIVWDTLIGANDGTPFTIPGEKKLIDTHRRLEKDAVPDFLFAKESATSADGVIARVNLKVARDGEPDVVLLTRWPGHRDTGSKLERWDIDELPIKNPAVDPRIQSDSAIVLYWNPRELKPGGKREVAFTYGLGTETGDSGLTLSVGGSFSSGGTFSVVAQVAGEHKDGRTATIKLPDGLELVGAAKAAQDVPPPFIDAAGASRPNPITWRVRSSRTGIFPITVETSDGKKQTKRISVSSGGIF